MARLRHIEIKLLLLPLAWFAYACSEGNQGTDPTNGASGNNARSSTDTATGGRTEATTAAEAAVAGGATGGSGTSSGSTGTGTGPGTTPQGAAGYNALAAPLPSIDCRVAHDGKTTLTLINHCSAKLEVRGSNWTGTTLEPAAFVCLNIGSDSEPLSSLRYWGYLLDDPGAEHHTLAEFTLNTDFNDFDWYDISHVDAHNLPMEIIPANQANCRTLSCPTSLLADCPAVGVLRDKASNIVSCVSPDRNNASSPVAVYFDRGCADAYAWSGDDAQSMVACAGEDYDVVFCP